MATGRIAIPFPGGFPHGATATCGWKKIQSSGAAQTNGVKHAHPRATFDQSTDEHWTWWLMVPGDYASGGTVRFKWGSDVTSGNVIWKAALGPVTDSTTDSDSVQYNATSVTSAIAVPGTSGHFREDTIVPDQATIALAANRMVALMLGRDADNGSDTAAGDAWLVGAIFEYTI